MPVKKSARKKKGKITVTYTINDPKSFDLAKAHAMELLKIINEINAGIDKLEARTPKDTLEGTGIG